MICLKASGRYAMKKTIGKKGLQNEFPENPEFAQKLYKWMLINSDQSNITFESFVRSGFIYHLAWSD